jgi:hypothetical protein
VQHALGMGLMQRAQQTASQLEGLRDGEWPPRQPLFQRCSRHFGPHPEQQLSVQVAVQGSAQPGAAQVAQQGIVPPHALESPVLERGQGSGPHHRPRPVGEVGPPPGLEHPLLVQTLGPQRGGAFVHVRQVATRHSPMRGAARTCATGWASCSPTLGARASMGSSLASFS